MRRNRKDGIRPGEDQGQRGESTPTTAPLGLVQAFSPWAEPVGVLEMIDHGSLAWFAARQMSTSQTDTGLARHQGLTGLAGDMAQNRFCESPDGRKFLPGG
jgi:hypothetical protein